MSSQDYIKYLVQQAVQYMDTPKDQRRERRRERRDNRLSWSQQWFGMVPFGIKMFAMDQRSRLEKKDR